MPAPMADLHAAILAALAGASSARPARADDVIALVGGDAADTWREIEHLVAERRIQTAHMVTAGRPWVALWPSGIHTKPGRVTGNQLSALFVRHDYAAPYLAHMPRSRPAPATR